MKKKTAKGKEHSIRQFPQSSAIAPQSCFVWANTNYAALLKTKPEATSTQTIAENNSIALLDPENNIIDAVGWGSSSDPFQETVPFPDNPLPGQVLRRKFSTSTAQYHDTDNNARDIELFPPLQPPASSTSPTEATSTAPATSTPPAVNPDRQTTSTEPAPSHPLHVVISEVQIRDKEFVEIYNPKDQPATTSGWHLAYFSQNSDWHKPQRNWPFPENAVIGAKSHYLIGIYDYPHQESKNPKLGYLPNSDWQVKTKSNTP